MNKIIIFSHWLGPLPEYLDWFKSSIENSTNVDWYVESDQEPPFEFTNLTWKMTTKKEFSDLFFEHTGFRASFEQGYQLCDARMYFGRIYKDLVSKYDFWGWSDWDIKATLNNLDTHGLPKKPIFFCSMASTPLLLLPSDYDWGKLVDVNLMNHTGNRGLDEAHFLRKVQNSYNPNFLQDDMMDPDNPYVVNMRLVKYQLREKK